MVSENRPQELIEQLELQPHPEGGWYREIYRSASVIPGTQRATVTSIYFLLRNGECSRWHLVDADEIWNHYEGDPLELFIAPPDGSRFEKHILGPAGENSKPVFVVPAGWWQAAQPRGSYALAGCAVAPGFEFSGFRFLNPDEAENFRRNFPGMEFLI